MTSCPLPVRGPRLPYIYAHDASSCSTRAPTFTTMNGNQTHNLSDDVERTDYPERAEHILFTEPDSEDNEGSLHPPLPRSETMPLVPFQHLVLDPNECRTASTVEAPSDAASSLPPAKRVHPMFLEPVQSDTLIRTSPRIFGPSSLRPVCEPSSMSRRRLASNGPALCGKLELPSPSEWQSTLGFLGLDNPLPGPRTAPSCSGDVTPITPVDQRVQTPIAPPELLRARMPKPRNLTGVHLVFDGAGLDYSPQTPIDLPFTSPVIRESPTPSSPGQRSSSLPPSNAVSTLFRWAPRRSDSDALKAGLRLPISPLRNTQPAKRSHYPLTGSCPKSHAPRPPALRLALSRRLSYKSAFGGPSTPPTALAPSLASPAVIQSFCLSTPSTPPMADAKASTMITPPVLVDSPGYFCL